MLVVLDEIHVKYTIEDYNPSDSWKKLSEEKIITFDFFDLDDFELTDELYLKMNARGKKLTHFENFKAWLIKNYQEDIEIVNWNSKLDLEWNDLFWNQKSKNNTKIDSAYLQFFKNMFLGDYLLNEDFTEKDKTIDLLRLTDDFNPLPFFKTNKNFQTNIPKYLELLDAFCSNHSEIKLNSLEKSPFTSPLKQ
jgi:hypothetical protein